MRTIRARADGLKTGAACFNGRCALKTLSNGCHSPMIDLQSNPKPREWSRFLDDWASNNPQPLADLHEQNVLHDADACAAFVSDDGPLQKALTDDSAAFAGTLRRFRHARLAAIAWCDLAGVTEVTQNLAMLSRLADICVASALAHAESVVSQGNAATPDASHLIVIGMGKLGGSELNFSSDIDLILARRRGDADDTDAQRHCKRVAQKLIATLSELTVDGFAYRVDTRLRPFGEAGELVPTVGAMENYYQMHGREWERYAWIKARPIAGDVEGGRELIARLRPFVYRRYLDYGAFESIRDMKTLIAKQVARRDMQANIKLGSGGIREIEFIAQAFQLIRGGNETALQDTRLLPVLTYLGDNDYLPKQVTDELRAAYLFLRRLENRLQMWSDQQTHDLPEDEQQRAVLAAAMDYDSWLALADAVADWRRQIQAHFQQVFAAPHVDEPREGPAHDLAMAWREDGEDGQGITALRDLGYHDPESSWLVLKELRSGALFGGLGHRGRRRLEELIPLMAGAAMTADQPDEVLSRVTGVLARIVGRTAYVDLLVENPAVLSRLITLCSASPWITAQIRAQPILLDSLLDPRVLYNPPNQSALSRMLAAALDEVPETDLERRMDVLRHFHHEQTLRVAAADVTNSMPLMVVSDYLTALAEVVVTAALAEAWREMIARHGLPRCTDGSQAGFAVIGYGKLGGLELGYGSDLDLVFLHEGSATESTDGPRPLDHQKFFLRLGQRTIHLLSTQTAAGRAYEVDTRLRPSGRSGLLVAGMDGFEHYQHDKAWTWEHQALVRARPVAGDDRLCTRFHTLRNRILSQTVDPDRLRSEVISMRARMRDNLIDHNPGELDLRQSRGGLIDIEFLSQYAVLRYAHECPELLMFTDTIRILETLESAQLLDFETTRMLTDAYRAYRVRVHAAALQQTRTVIADDAFVTERRVVEAMWQAWLGDSV